MKISIKYVLVIVLLSVLGLVGVRAVVAEPQWHGPAPEFAELW